MQARSQAWPTRGDHDRQAAAMGNESSKDVSTFKHSQEQLGQEKLSCSHRPSGKAHSKDGCGAPDVRPDDYTIGNDV